MGGSNAKTTKNSGEKQQFENFPEINVQRPRLNTIQLQHADRPSTAGSKVPMPQSTLAKGARKQTFNQVPSVHETKTTRLRAAQQKAKEDKAAKF